MSNLGSLLERYGLVIVWVAVIAIFGFLRPDTFLTWSNFSSIFGSEAVLVIVTLGLIIPLTAGDFDLSIAQTADITVMHESADLNLPAAPASLASYPPAKFAYLALGISNLTQTQAATLSSLYQQGVGYVYLTDQGNGNDPWAKLSTSYPAQIQIIQALNQSKN